MGDIRYSHREHPEQYPQLSEEQHERLDRLTELHVGKFDAFYKGVKGAFEHTPIRESVLDLLAGIETLIEEEMQRVENPEHERDPDTARSRLERGFAWLNAGEYDSEVLAGETPERFKQRQETEQG